MFLTFLNVLVEFLQHFLFEVVVVRLDICRGQFFVALSQLVDRKRDGLARFKIPGGNRRNAGGSSARPIIEALA
jgi:hypothetical protein